MRLEDKLDELIRVINKEQKINFCIFCVERVLELYVKIDENEDLSIVDSTIFKGKAFENLKEIFDVVKKNRDLNTIKIEELIRKCDPLILDIEEVFENTTINEVALLVAQGVDYLLRYILKSDDKYISYCSSNNIEILNQLKSEEYCQRNNFEVDDDDLENYLNSIFEHEMKLQIKGLEYIKNQDHKSLEELISDSKIE